MKRKILFLLLLLSSAATGFAQNASGTCGENLTWTLADGTLTVSGTGEMADYNYLNNDCPWDRNSIKSVIIEDGVTGIGNYAFSYCDNLTSITIGNSVTSIGEYAFYRCFNLTSVTIPNSVTSIGNFAFHRCSLTSVDIPNSVTKIGNGAFRDCLLTSVTIGSGVTSIGVDAFDFCANLTAIDVSEDNTAYSSENGVVFNKEKTILVLYPAGKPDVEYAIPNSVTGIGYEAFVWCKNLTSVTIGNSVIDIGERAFYMCTNLTSITIGNSVTVIRSEAFSTCPSLTAIDVSEDNTAYSSENGVLFNKEKTILVQYPAGKPDVNYAIPNSVTGIGHYAFFTCLNLTSVTIGNSVTGIEYEAFPWCYNLASITIGNSVTSIRNNAFRNCRITSLTNLNPTPQAINSSVFYGVNLSDATLYVPAESVEIYRTTPVWEDFGSVKAYVPLAIDAPANTNAVRIYFDPATKSFRIEGLDAPAQVTIINTGGQTVWRQTVREGENIPAAHLPRGIYFVRVNGKTFKTKS